MNGRDDRHVHVRGAVIGFMEERPAAHLRGEFEVAVGPADANGLCAGNTARHPTRFDGDAGFGPGSLGFRHDLARKPKRATGERFAERNDVGVAGIHRLLANREALTKARVIVVCAGMEGALPSVVGGLVGVPVIAVPTSVGYGASFKGIAALLGMMNSCASNVSVVNIDNGFGAGYVASLINRA